MNNAEIAEKEHLKIVARRNAELYRRNKKLFERKMQGCGWSNDEIQRMERYIEKEERKPQES